VKLNPGRTTAGHYASLDDKLFAHANAACDRLERARSRIKPPDASMGAPQFDFGDRPDDLRSPRRTTHLTKQRHADEASARPLAALTTPRRWRPSPRRHAA
jgi:hypothetical protein